MTLASQTALTLAANWFPAKPPTGYRALSQCEGHENRRHDVEVCTLKPASDIEIASPVTGRPTPPRMKMLEALKTFAILTSLPTPTRTKTLEASKTFAILVAFGLPSALFCSAYMWYAGGYILYSLELPPYTSMGVMDMFRASMAGAPLVVLVVSAAALVLSGSPRPDSSDDAQMACIVAVVCAPLSVFAMPLGFVMMPHLMVEGFGLRHALAMSATGLGILVAAFVLALPRILTSR